MRILVVDDDRLVRAALMRSLRRMAGIDPTDFSTPHEALAHARDNAFEAAILDLQMPQMDGVALARELTRIHPALVIVFTTANSGSELATEARLFSAHPILAKPWSLADLEAALKF